MPAYKTIVIEFLKEQHPDLHDRLRASRRLQRTVSAYAAYLKSKHVAWIDSFLPTAQWGDARQVGIQSLALGPTETPSDDFPRHGCKGLTDLG